MRLENHMKTQYKKLFFVAATMGVVVASMLVALSIFATTGSANASGVSAKDTFHRANQNGWGTSSDGHRWGGDAHVAHSFIIQNNTGVIDAARGKHGTFNPLLGASLNNA